MSEVLKQALAVTSHEQVNDDCLGEALLNA